MDLITLAMAKQLAKEYTDSQISTISGMNVHVCAANEYDAQTGLPIISNPDTSTIYLVSDGDTINNIFNEYYYINNSWELFGVAGLDMENLATAGDLTLGAGTANETTITASQLNLLLQIQSAEGVTF